MTTARPTPAPAEIAHVLVHALPYVRRFAGRTVVVKMGGGAMTDEALNRQLAEDVLLLQSVGVRLVLVHGGGPQIDALMRALGLEPEFRDGLRVTNAETLELVRMVLVGRINRELVSAINRVEPVGIGVSGEDGRLLLARPRDPALGFVGDVEAVNASVLERLLDDGLVPVVSTVGTDADGQAYNINADAAAAAIAAALGAEKIVYLTAAPGLLRDKDDPDSLVPRLRLDEARALLDGREVDGFMVDGGMIPKLRACADAVAGGVATAHILDGRVPRVLLIELLTDEGIGTMIAREPSS